MAAKKRERIKRTWQPSLKDQLMGGQLMGVTWWILPVLVNGHVHEGAGHGHGFLSPPVAGDGRDVINGR